MILTEEEDGEDNFWFVCEVRGDDSIYTGYGSSRKAAVKDAVTLWSHMMPEVIPDQIKVEKENPYSLVP